ncbi:hypothetical protein ACTI_06570 [Actinoplanes sp. OR16]|nr:hypothetical protein ACTI_06570 [Actinoplanes sp. OR16]
MRSGVRHGVGVNPLEKLRGTGIADRREVAAQALQRRQHRGQVAGQVDAGEGDRGAPLVQLTQHRQELPLLGEPAVPVGHARLGHLGERALPAADPAVHRETLAEPGFHGDHREAEFLHEEAHHPAAQLPELRDVMGRLPHRDHPGVPDESGKRFEVVVQRDHPNTSGAGSERPGVACE